MRSRPGSLFFAAGIAAVPFSGRPPITQIRPLCCVISAAPIPQKIPHDMQKQGRMSRFEFVIVFLVLPRLPLRGSWRGAPERARPLMWNRRHSDSLALTKALLIAARCLCITGLALSVCCADTSPKGRGFLLTVKPSFVQPLRHGFAVPPPLVGEALAFRSALPLRQRLPY